VYSTQTPTCLNIFNSKVVLKVKWRFSIFQLAFSTQLAISTSNWRFQPNWRFPSQLAFFTLTGDFPTGDFQLAISNWRFPTGDYANWRFPTGDFQLAILPTGDFYLAK